MEHTKGLAKTAIFEKAEQSGSDIVVACIIFFVLPYCPSCVIQTTPPTANRHRNGESRKHEITEQRNNGISKNYILNILLLYIQSIAFIQYSPRSNSTKNH